MIDTKTGLLALIVDKLANLVWMLSDEGAKGSNPPASVFQALSGICPEQPEKEIMGYDSAAAFEAAKAAILRGGG